MDDTLAKLFNSNEQWSEAVKAADPKFFENSAKGQSPKVSVTLPLKVDHIVSPIS
jgi:carbonic anhydrase